MKSRYMKFNCPECGELLEVYYEGPIEERRQEPWDIIFGYRVLIRHCDNCGCDWENEWFGDELESELKRKFWG